MNMNVNKTDVLSWLAHAALAVCWQLLFWAALSPWFGHDAALAIGAAFGVGNYFGKERTNAEDAFREHPEWGKMHWWRGYDLRYWTLDNWCDLGFPVVACLGVYFGWR